MQLITHKRQVEEHRKHMQRIRNISPCIDTSIPSTLGLKHLATRPKKQQLIEDRHQVVAMENKILMEKMTKIMSDDRPQETHKRPQSLNEIERKHLVDKVNSENRLMLERLRGVTTTLNPEKMEKDFEHHAKSLNTLRRKQLPFIDGTPLRSSVASQQELFDAASYISQRASEVGMEPSQSDSPIKSMAEFRKHVISNKVLSKAGSTLMQGAGSTTTSRVSKSGGGQTDSRYELSHSPSTS